jgi:RNA polymerase sigma-70 factor (ECF subfamily)
VPDVDPAVLDAARVGAGWAYERIYGLLAPAVHGYLRGAGIDDPEGAVNDVFLRAFGAIAGFEGSPVAFRSWVFTIAHHLIVDRRRFASRRPAAAATVRLPERAAGGPSPEDAAVAGAERAQLERLLALLTVEQRDVLLLRFVADLSLEEVAAATGRSVGAVKATQHRAIASVRRLLDDLGENVDEAVSPRSLTTLARS